MILSTLVSLMIPLPLLQAQTPVSCEVAQITGQCALLKSRMDEEYIYLEDGTYFPNPQYENSWWSAINRNNSPPFRVSQARQDRVSHLAQQAKDSIINSIKNGRPDTALTPAEKNQIQRIKTVNIDIKASATNKSGKCSTARTNAHYDSSRHEILLCASTMMLPDSGLIYVLGHELGHSIDSCAMSQDLERSANSYQVAELVRSVIPATKFEPASVVSPGLELADLPDQEIYSCLEGYGYLQRYTSAEATKLAAKFVDSTSKTRTPEEARRRTINLGNFIQKHPGCFNGHRHGNSSGEAYSDLIGARVLGDYLAQNPPKSETDKMAIFGAFVQEICADTQSERDSTNVHPPSLDRMNRILLANPKIKSALGCKGGHIGCDRNQSAGSPNSDPSAPRSTNGVD